MNIWFNVNLWRNVEIIRDYKKEDELFKYLELSKNEEYNLINRNHRPRVRNDGQPIKVDNGFRNVNMNIIEGYSLIDWIGVMVNAKSIHTVATSILFVMEVIDEMPEDIHIYKRCNEKANSLWDHTDYAYLFNKDYIYH